MEQARDARIHLGRHFDDVRDLRYEFDPVLLPLTGIEKAQISEQASSLTEELASKEQKNLIIISSQKVRGRDSAHIYKEAFREANPTLAVRVGYDQHFADLFHGRIQIPVGYKPGDTVDFLPEAWRAFWSETFNQDGTLKNPDYKYGDPLAQGDKIQYPSLANNFLELGESYKDFFLRNLKGFLDYYSIYQTNWDRSWAMVLVAHSSTIRLLQDLEACAQDLFFMKNYRHGQLMSMCRQKRLEQKESEKESMEYGELKNYPTDEFNQEFISILEKEIAYLSSEEGERKELQLQIPVIHKPYNQLPREYEVGAYNPTYEVLFEEERRALEGIFDSVVKRIEHVGSTSVKGLNGKSTIDILVDIGDTVQFTPGMLKLLQENGYEYYIADFGTRIFLYREVKTRRSFHIHVVSSNNERGRKMLAFRDLLKSNPELVEKYNKIKKDYFEKSQGNYEAYRALKDSWIRKIMFIHGLEE